ncbi:PIG-L deacetylase family protein [Methylopila henanensis]|uniref:PIG-L deacetylase family protein n=1 Tax=Methylopila henanensis TaxID=873516 RepID=A0ABW4KER0_9HYPH
MTPRFPTPLKRSRWAKARWLVLAPHADDETIGAGALIAEATAGRRLVAVAFLTDGRASHGPDGPADLAAIRRREACAALRTLAPGAPSPVFLDWPDAHPPAPGSPVWTRGVRRLEALCRARRVDAIATTSALDPHCDHKAASALARAVAAAVMRPIEVFDYVVWAERPPRGPAYRTEPSRPGPRRLALAAHRSQTTPLHGEGFRVPERLKRMPKADVLYLDGSPHAP